MITNNEQIKCYLKYVSALRQLPAPGYGHGCHQKILSVSSLGHRANVAPEVVFRDIRNHIPIGLRIVDDSEITKTIERAFGSTLSNPSRMNVHPSPELTRMSEELIAERLLPGRKWTTVDIFRSSPIPFTNIPSEMAIRFLRTLFQPSDYLFIGEERELGILGKNIKTVEEWIQEVSAGNPLCEFFVVNALTGQQGETKDGKPSFRCDNCVRDFRYALVEFDTLSFEDQVAFWAISDLPVAALIHSGHKSIHGILDVSCQNSVEWKEKVNSLYLSLVAWGADQACKHPSRFSRMPGQTNSKYKNPQTLMYLTDNPSVTITDNLNRIRNENNDSN